MSQVLASQASKSSEISIAMPNQKEATCVLFSTVRMFLRAVRRGGNIKIADFGGSIEEFQNFLQYIFSKFFQILLKEFGYKGTQAEDVFKFLVEQINQMILKYQDEGTRSVLIDEFLSLPTTDEIEIIDEPTRPSDERRAVTYFFYKLLECGPMCCYSEMYSFGFRIPSLSHLFRYTTDVLELPVGILTKIPDSAPSVVQKTVVSHWLKTIVGIKDDTRCEILSDTIITDYGITDPYRLEAIMHIDFFEYLKEALTDVASPEELQLIQQALSIGNIPPHCSDLLGCGITGPSAIEREDEIYWHMMMITKKVEELRNSYGPAERNFRSIPGGYRLYRESFDLSDYTSYEVIPDAEGDIKKFEPVYLHYLIPSNLQRASSRQPFTFTSISNSVELKIFDRPSALFYVENELYNRNLADLFDFEGRKLFEELIRQLQWGRMNKEEVITRLNEYIESKKEQLKQLAETRPVAEPIIVQLSDFLSGEEFYGFLGNLIDKGVIAIKPITNPFMKKHLSLSIPSLFRPSPFGPPASLPFESPKKGEKRQGEAGEPDETDESDLKKKTGETGGSSYIRKKQTKKSKKQLKKSLKKNIRRIKTNRKTKRKL